MGLFDFLRRNKKQTVIEPHKADNAVAASAADPMKEQAIRNASDCFADSSSISPDERPFYRPDNYYTYYSYPGAVSSRKVITFEERKKTTYPSSRGLYAAEILLLEYCKQGKYPKPAYGYPGFWWFKYGIRDVGHALESLEKRGFIRWRSKADSLAGMKADELKSILADRNLSKAGKKADLIARIIKEIPENEINIPDNMMKYELTETGKTELTENGYVPYMHKHSNATTEDSTFGEPFTVWGINRLFPDGDAKNWLQVVGAIEKKRFGVDMATSYDENKSKIQSKPEDRSDLKDEMRDFLSASRSVISKGVKTEGDGFEEESKGFAYISIGKDKEALVMLYIAIGKGFDAPALYRETSILLRKYGMLEEELSVIDAGIKNIPCGNRHRDELIERRKKVQELMRK